MNEWLYDGEIFTSEMIGDYLGFVYEIVDPNGKKYLGQKRFHRKITRPPLKGKKRKRIVYKESDWRTYYGSSSEVQELVEQHGPNHFSREIIRLCKTKGEMNYMEAYYQFKREVLLRDDYYNGIIQCRINQSHVKDLIITKERNNE